MSWSNFQHSCDYILENGFTKKQYWLFVVLPFFLVSIFYCLLNSYEISKATTIYPDSTLLSILNEIAFMGWLPFLFLSGLRLKQIFVSGWYQIIAFILYLFLNDIIVDAPFRESLVTAGKLMDKEQPLSPWLMFEHRYTLQWFPYIWSFLILFHATIISIIPTLKKEQTK
jgi:hypothetical protein